MALNVPYFMPSFRKIVGAVSEKLLRTDGRTHGRTHGGDFIGPFGFQPGTNNIAFIARIQAIEAIKVIENIYIACYKSMKNYQQQLKLYIMR